MNSEFLSLLKNRSIEQIKTTVKNTTYIVNRFKYKRVWEQDWHPHPHICPVDDRIETILSYIKSRCMEEDISSVIKVIFFCNVHFENIIKYYRPFSPLA